LLLAGAQALLPRAISTTNTTSPIIQITDPKQKRKLNQKKKVPKVLLEMGSLKSFTFAHPPLQFLNHSPVNIFSIKVLSPHKKKKKNHHKQNEIIKC